MRRCSDDAYEVYELRPEHNHEVLEEEEIAALAQNRFIPDDIQSKMLELNSLGVLSCNQIMTLIENVHFPNVSKTWTTRDVQNLFQSQSNRSFEANDFVKLLDEKTSAGWSTSIHLNETTMRLERICWISKNGYEKCQQLNDVLEIDATYKTNRFGMPLILFTVVDNHGLAILIGGGLVSNEKYESYAWTLEKFQMCFRRAPKVVFTDGDSELMREIQAIWPQSLHLLCRFHIAQNIIRALSGTLRSDLNQFMDDFWRIASIEDIVEYENEFAAMNARWPQAKTYLNILQSKQEKFAFAYTHCHFVAGVSSTQRQEMVNCQLISALMSNSNLCRIIDGFENVEKKTAAKIIQATLDTKLSKATPDPMIEQALQSLTSYAGALLKAESVLSLSYLCNPHPD